MSPLDASHVSIASRSALDFRATARLGLIPFALRSTWSMDDGAIRVRPSSRLSITKIAETGATVFRIPLGGGVFVEKPPELACAMLRIGAPRPAAVTTLSPRARPSGRTFHITPGVLYIRRTPDAEESLRLSTNGLDLPVAESRGGWVHVRGELPHGRIDGWTSVPHIRPRAHRGSQRGARSVTGVARTTEPVTRVRLSQGRGLHIGRNGPRWATARSDFELAEVIIRPDDDWAQVFRIDGIGDAGRNNLSNVWVRRIDLVPANVGKP